MLNRVLLSSALLFWVSLCQAASLHEATENLAQDVKLLQDAGVVSDGPGLLQFFRKKTLSEEQRRQIEELVQQLGSKNFAVRDKATKQLIALGHAAAPALEQALQEGDLEMVSRVKLCLEARKGQAPGELYAAAVRILVARKQPQSVEVLLAFLPDAGDVDVEDEIVRALAVVGVRDGKADRALVKALTDKLPLRRAVTCGALGLSGLPDHKDAIRKFLRDPERVVRLHVALVLVFAKEKEAVAVLIDLLPQLSQRRALQVEDILCQLAEGHVRPAATLGDGEADRNKCRDAWAAWWKDHAAKVDLANLRESASGWVRLFNRKDLAGWKTHPSKPGDWRVETGILIGRGPQISYLYTERDDYEDLHFRVEAKINLGGNSGQEFRKQFGAKGYQAQIDSSSHKAKTGSLYLTTSPAVGVYEVLIPVDTWFTQEVIVRGNHIVILVNGRKTVDFVDQKNTYVRGHLALEVYDAPTVVQFRRIEVKELK